MYIPFDSETDAADCQRFVDRLYEAKQVDPPVVFPHFVNGVPVEHRTTWYPGNDGKFYIGFDTYTCAFIEAAQNDGDLETILEAAFLSVEWWNAVETLMGLNIIEYPRDEI